MTISVGESMSGIDGLDYVHGYMNVSLGYRCGWERIVVKFRDVEEYGYMIEQVEAIGEGWS